MPRKTGCSCVILQAECSVNLELLAREPLITHEDGATIREMVRKKFADKGLSFTPFLELNFQWSNRDAIPNVAANGLGIGFTFELRPREPVKISSSRSPR